MRRLLKGLALALCLAGLATSLQAQTQITTGVIQGTVSDPSGAVVPGAEVQVKNAQTNLTRSLTTGEDGRFVFLLLPSGNYTVTTTKAGFATLVRDKVTVSVGQAVILNLTMKVSGGTETVTVSGTPTVDTSRTEVSNVLNETTISTTPILGRKFEDLLTLTPGVSVVQGPDGDEITFNGQRGVFNNISLDGGDYNNGFFGEQMGGQRAAIDITLDAVKEFQVVAQGANAEYGRTAGGVVNVITKSGTNDLHGSLFYFQTARSADLQHLRRQALEGLQPRAVRRHPGRSDREGQGLLLRGPRRHPREPAAAEPLRAHRHPLSRLVSDDRRQRGPDRRAAPTASGSPS